MLDDNREGSYHLFLIRLKDANRQKRDLIIDEMADKGISLNVHYKPLPLLTAYASRGYKMEDYPRSSALFESVISLPVFYDLSLEQIDYLCDMLEEVLNKVI
jgi:dTDP-4-amino-4,6-dideoxygalactose transaminase